MYDDYKVKLLHIMLQKTSIQTKLVLFFIKNDDLLEKYNAIWSKVSADIKKEFDSEPVTIKIF